MTSRIPQLEMLVAIHLFWYYIIVFAVRIIHCISISFHFDIVYFIPFSFLTTMIVQCFMFHLIFCDWLNIILKIDTYYVPPASSQQFHKSCYIYIHIYILDSSQITKVTIRSFILIIYASVEFNFRLVESVFI